MQLQAASDWLVYLLVRIFICIVQAMRIETCSTVAHCLAFLACDVLHIRGAVVRENLQLVFPDSSEQQRRRLARKMWHHLLLMVCEIAHAPRKIHRSNWMKYVKIKEKRQFLTLLLSDRPTVIISGHFGNFEIGGFVTGLLGFPTHTVARKLDNPHLDEFVNRFRSVNGQFIIPKKDSAHLVERLLQQGGALSLLGDQHAGDKGCWVDFFGRPASCHKAIALFPLTSGAPLAVSYAKRADKPLTFELGMAGLADPENPTEEMASLTTLTQWYNEVLEIIIRKSPSQYWWLHRRWRTPPERITRRRQAA